MKNQSIKLPFIMVCLFVLTGFTPQAQSNSQTPAKPKLSITVNKSPENQWIVSYQTITPAKQLGFIRNPDNSRTKRWKPVSDDFKIIYQSSYQGKQEFIVRKDGKAFTRAEFILTPTYKHLTKDYAPFSPYSKDGRLIYTGRLFACINQCDGQINQWHLTFNIPKSEHLIAHNKIIKDTYSWIDSDRGINVYVGKQQPIKTDSVIALIDPALPDVIKTSIGKDIPKLIQYFEKHLGKLQGEKPTLFASYANVAGTSSQGGTLPGQIFMHWNANNLDELVKDDNYAYRTLWFFAHEIAHYYQHNGPSVLSNQAGESWMHEGNADWLAALALTEIYPHTQAFVDNKINAFEKHCAEGLSKMPLVEAAENNAFELYYTCGLFIHRAIDEALQAKQANIYILWNDLREQIKEGRPAGADTFLSIAEQKTSKQLIEKIRRLINTKVADPFDALKAIKAPLHTKS